MTRLEQSIEVNAPARTVYNQLTQFEDYPQFMNDVEQVRQVDDTHLHWRAKMNGFDMEWDAEIMEQVPDHFIAWRSADGPVKTETMEVRPLGDRKSKVTMTMEYEQPQLEGLPQDIDLETAIAEHAVHDLVRFKRFIESRDRETGAWRGEVHKGQMPGAIGAVNPQTWLPNLLYAWEEPFMVMRKMTDEMDQIFERFVGRPMYGGRQRRLAASAASAWSPPLEVAERGNQLFVRAELPGVKQEDVQVQIRNGRLVIEGDRAEEPQQAGQELHRSERSYGHFYRAVALPEGVDPEAAAASMRDGVLEVVLPVQQAARQGRQLDIRSS